MSHKKQSLRSAQNIKNSAKTEKSNGIQVNDTMESTVEHIEPEIEEMLLFKTIMGKLAKLDEIDCTVSKVWKQI